MTPDQIALSNAAGAQTLQNIPQAIPAPAQPKYKYGDNINTEMSFIDRLANSLGGNYEANFAYNPENTAMSEAEQLAAFIGRNESIAQVANLGNSLAAAIGGDSAGGQIAQAARGITSAPLQNINNYNDTMATADRNSQLLNATTKAKKIEVPAAG